MISKLISLLDSKIAICLRLLCCGATMLLLSMALFGYQAPTPKEFYDLSIEHRLSELEANYISTHEDIQDMKHELWIVIAGTLGLTGEAGLRIIKSRKKAQG